MLLPVLFCILAAMMHCIMAIPSNMPVLTVTLSQVTNTRIKAEVKNTGAEDLTIVHLNFFGDTAPIKKVSVFHNETELSFSGIKARLSFDNLTPDAVTTIPAGQILSDEFDLASTIDIAHSGDVTVYTSGFVPVTTDLQVTSYLPYYSNVLKMTVDAIKASTIPKALSLLRERTVVTSCTAEKKASMHTTLLAAVHLSLAAANESYAGPAARMEEYFKSSEKSVRDAVTNRYLLIASEASIEADGKTTIYCEDPYGVCTDHILAYTWVDTNTVVSCPIFWRYLIPVNSWCHWQDQATTLIHEYAHCPAVCSPGTDDKAYGYNACRRLSTEEALLNADTYALFANAVYAKC
ncbi:deuterolysin metalloprotease family protein [Aspergillus heteromorphus CBS 117.55]|uniref:Neutral protease 2 n=1 Tax=Aspergillus heteromorphus CBS 117.55 TaxID=1448321 RepID=A0A317V1G7_9EURO|nr:deuterolysin metalloprotease family protein [Aspergillus heteromorphus CBS 117.55]PWY67905.1 deuterolysin metalloprotease family protein [Aspergillus heteromorphus CBS 117.55]